MEGQDVPLVNVKKEPEDHKEKKKEPTNESVACEVAVSPCNVKKSVKRVKSAEELMNVKRIKKEVQAPTVKDGKPKKTGSAEEQCIEPPRAGVFPYRTKSDFCCTICNAHMNSIQMWESHIRGKRHLKNSKKGNVTVSAPLTVKKEIPENVAGLYYIDTQGAQSPQHETIIYERRQESPADSKTKESPEPTPSVVPGPSNMESRSYSDLNITMTEKINYILQLAAEIYPQTESDFHEIKSILSALTQSVLQYEIRQLPLAAQQKLAKELFKGN